VYLLQEHLLQKPLVPTVVVEESALTDGSDETSSDDGSYSFSSDSLPSLVESSDPPSLEDGVDGMGDGDSDNDAVGDGYLPSLVALLQEESTPGGSCK